MSWHVPTGQLGLAVMLLVGVLTLGYGFAAPNRIALYVGLFITAAGVLSGAVRVITGPER